MRSRWEALHAGLVRSIEDRDGVSVFDKLRLTSTALERFGNAVSLVGFMTHEGGDLDEKDRILGALIRSAGERPTQRLAHALLILCLWRGLDTIFERRLHLFRLQPQDLAAEIVGRLTSHVRRIDLRRVTRIAAALVRGTERDVVRARMRELTLAARSTEEIPEVAADPPGEVLASPFGLARDQSDEDEVGALRKWLERAVGRDADFVVEAVIHGRPRCELACGLGISPVAARKRLERALARARRAFPEEDLSHSGSTLAFSGR